MTRVSLHSLLKHAAAKPAVAAGPVTYVADCSVWQPDINDAAYLAWSRAIIVRALDGTVTDQAWYGGQRRDLLHAGGALFVGIYAYITAADSVVTQARALLDLVGELRPGEKLIADIEEGSGSQAGRWAAWAKVIAAATGDWPWCYSDLDFAEERGLAPEWVAAFGKDEPAGSHILWQFTDAYQVPGIETPCDCSIARCSVEELSALAYQPGAQPAPAPEPAAPKPAPVTVPDDWQEQIMAALPVLKLGDKDTSEPWMVRRVQGLVDALGPDCAVTGEFDAATETAVKDFQENHGIAADGVVGPATWSMLITGSAA
ncbi:MAG: peptidoglycan-binding protein [Streptosporangiaceae bacterium]